jgi:hypothetical protein
MEQISNIVNNKAVGNAFFNLYDRWLDESEYEDINEYGKAITNTIVKEFPTYNVTLIKATKRPFGVKVKVCDVDVHVWIKIKGRYASICAKRI